MNTPATDLESIFQLLYTSESSQPVTQQLITEILQVSRKNNMADSITGFLIVRDGFFLQLLEGDEAKVRSCFAKIQKDPRHKSIVIQGETTVNQRLMPHWGMGFVRPESVFCSSIELLELFELGRRGQKYSSPESIRALLKQFSLHAQVII